jgi:hypothetical protein
MTRNRVGICLVLLLAILHFVGIVDVREIVNNGRSKLFALYEKRNKPTLMDGLMNNGE